ncbi:MAG: hypothetical protein ACLPRE_09550 [Limisphaerales bacterium]
MAKPEPLPERLRYLEPYREFLAKIPKSKIDEGTDTTLLCDLVREQIREKTEAEAKEKLAADLEELGKYLSSRRDDRLHFVLGCFLIAIEDPEEFVKPPEKPEERIIMELPPKAKSKYFEEWSLIVNWKRQHFSASPLDMTYNYGRRRFLTQLAHPDANDYELYILMGETAMAEMVYPKAREIHPMPSVAVHFGKVTGHKRVVCDDSPPFFRKTVRYKLQIPGGYATVSIDAKILFDESEWEYYLPTLRIEKTVAK